MLQSLEGSWADAEATAGETMVAPTGEEAAASAGPHTARAAPGTIITLPVGAAPRDNWEQYAKRLLPEEQIAFLPGQLRAQLRLSRILAG